MRNLLLDLRFDGTRYHGFQVQKNALSVCQVFQDAVQAVFGERLDVKGCSRTDTGVHANQYCLSMRCAGEIPCERVAGALNRHLPDDIAVARCREVPADFHARYDCTGKEYVYKLLNSRVKDPFAPRLLYRYPVSLDARLLCAQAKDFLGTHDFAAFCASGSAVQDMVRTVRAFTVERLGEQVHFTVEGDGFLYNMVRIMVGTLVYIGAGKIPAGGIPDILRGRDRGRAGKTMPAHGLYLNRVFYPEESLGGSDNS